LVTASLSLALEERSFQPNLFLNRNSSAGLLKGLVYCRPYFKFNT